MRIEAEDLRKGNRVVYSLNGIVLISGTALDVDITKERFKTDYMNEYTQHKRDQWISFDKLLLCEASDVDDYTKIKIIECLKKRIQIDTIY